MTGEDLVILQKLSEALADMHARILPDGREATVLVQMFNVQLVVGPPGKEFVDDGW